jgi:hypothetical protein
MSKFCGSCGAPLTEGAGFCGACGASAQQAASPAAPPAFQPLAQTAAVAQPAPAAAAGPGLGTPVPAAQSSNTWVKVAVVVVAIIFVGGAIAVAGVLYVAHKVSQKAHEYAHQALSELPSVASAATTPASAGNRGPDASAPQADPASSLSASGFAGDACRLLSKQAVSHAIGIEVVETKTTDGGCSYLAKGTSVDMVAKHAAAMVGAKGADKKSQGMIEQFAGLVGDSMPEKEKSDLDNGDGNTVVLAFGIDANQAEEQMKLNAKGLGFGGMGPIDTIDGLGDAAFSKADSMMFVRKGDKLIRIIYSSCPCGTAAIRPLARQIVANL